MTGDHLSGSMEEWLVGIFIGLGACGLLALAKYIDMVCDPCAGLRRVIAARRAEKAADGYLPAP